MKSKKGLSEAVSTVMVIALVLVVVGIVWVVVQNLVSNSQEDIEIGLSKVSLNIDKSATSVEGDTISIKVNRNIGKGNLTGIEFILSTDSNEEVIKEDTEMKELEGEKFVLNSPNKIKKVSIAPIFKTSSGREVIGKIQDTYEF